MDPADRIYPYPCRNERAGLASQTIPYMVRSMSVNDEAIIERDGAFFGHKCSRYGVQTLL